MIPYPEYELPYEGSKEMLLIDSDDRDFVSALVEAICSDLPEPKKKR